MLHLDLTTDEAEVLQAALQNYISELRQEVSHTENWQFKASLKQNEAHLRRVLDCLAVGAPEPA